MQLMMAFLSWLVTDKPMLFIAGLIVGGLISVTVKPYASAMYWLAGKGASILAIVLGGQ